LGDGLRLCTAINPNEKAMDSFHDAMLAALRKLPNLILSQLIAEKLVAQKIKLSKRRLNELAAQILKGKNGKLKFTVGKGQPTKTVAIKLTEDDADRLGHQVDTFLESLPTLVENLADEMSNKLLVFLKKRWPEERREQRKEIAYFRKQLDRQWSIGLDGLRMLLTITREFGSDFLNENINATVAVPVTLDVLIRLHARACQVTDEIICLLSHGFADGAMARWRTMQEIAAVCLLICEHGEELAKRYKAHDIVETRKAAAQYNKYRHKLGHEAVTDAELAEIELRYNAALAEYGPEFGNRYGWAAKHLNNPRPTIAHIQEGSSIDYLAPYYRLASDNVHANPKGVFFKLGLIGESNILLSGPSNAGLADPGHAAVLSLAQISSALLPINQTFENIVKVKIMTLLVEEIAASFLDAHEKMLADDDAHLKSQIAVAKKSVSAGIRKTKRNRKLGH
jgi:hypothetical protein